MSTEKKKLDPIKITHTDAKGTERELELRVDVLCMRRLRRRDPKIEILKVVDRDNPKEGLWAKMLEDPGIAVDIAYEATRHDPNAKGMSEEDFATGLAGDAVDEITQKALEAVVRFTPNRQNRAVLEMILSKSAAAIDDLRGEAIKAIESGELEKAIEAELEKETAKIKKSAGQIFTSAQTSTPSASSKRSSSSSGGSASTPGHSTGGSKKGSSKGVTPSES